MLVSANVGSIKEEIGFRLNEAESDNTTNYLNWINLCLRDIQDSFPNAPFLRTSANFTLTTGSRIYQTSSIDPNYYRMNSITDPTGQVRLMFVMPEQFDVAIPSASETGTPRIYTVRGYGPSARIEFYPIPTQGDTLYCDYQTTIGMVSAESAVPNLPFQYVDLPIIYSEFRGLRRRGEYQESSAVQQEYEAMKEKMRQDLLVYTNELPRIKSDREFTKSNQSWDDPIKNMFWGRIL